MTAVTLFPPDGFYASALDDPVMACQCPACRNNHAIAPVPLAYDARGYDQFGYDRNGLDRYGLSHLDRYGYDSGGYDEDGYDRAGYDSEGYDSGGYNSDGLNEYGYNREGYDEDGYDEDGYDEDGYDEDGYDEDGYNREGYNSDGLNEYGYNREGYDEDGYDGDGYDSDGYDRRGIDQYGQNSDGDYWCSECECAPCECRDDGCDCESPQQDFTIRNNDGEPLANDTRITITLPAGTISDEGLNEIRRYLRSQDGTSMWTVTNFLDTIGNQWQTRAGNFPKRLSKHAYQHAKIKIPPEILARVGDIARKHTAPASVTIDVTRDLNQDASEFFHEGSCWWGEYSESRCALKTNGGFGLRSFEGHYVSGRAWVMPLRKDRYGDLIPTFGTMTPDAFMVFNGYGDLSGYAAPRIVAHMTGWTYQKTDFRCRPMYVNAGGYLVAPEDLAEQYSGELYLGVPQHADLFYTEQKESVNA